MKKTFFLLMGLLVLVAYMTLSITASAGPLSHVVLPSFTAGAGTGTNATQTLTYALSGKLKEICLDLSGTASPTVAVTVVTSTGGSVPLAQTLLSETITADARRHVRKLTVNSSGSAFTEDQVAPYYLQHDFISVTADSTKTGITVQAWLIFDNN